MGNKVIFKGEMKGKEKMMQSKEKTAATSNAEIVLPNRDLW